MEAAGGPVLFILCIHSGGHHSRIFASRSGLREANPLHPAVQTVFVSTFAMLLCLIPAMFEDPLTRLAAIGWREWFALFWYGAFVTALAFIFWCAGIRRCKAVTAAAFSGMTPFTSLVLSVLLLGENAGLRQWSGGALVIAGIVLIGSRSGGACKAGNPQSKRKTDGIFSRNRRLLECLALKSATGFTVSKKIFHLFKVF